jgi:hypothetical protein
MLSVYLKVLLALSLLELNWSVFKKQVIETI